MLEKYYIRKKENTLHITFMVRKEKKWYFIYLKTGDFSVKIYYKRKKLT